MKDKNITIHNIKKEDWNNIAIHYDPETITDKHKEIFNKIRLGQEGSSRPCDFFEGERFIRNDINCRFIDTRETSAKKQVIELEDFLDEHNSVTTYKDENFESKSTTFGLGVHEEYYKSVTDIDVGNKTPLELFKEGKAFVDIEHVDNYKKLKEVCDSNYLKFDDFSDRVGVFIFEVIDNIVNQIDLVYPFDSKEEIKRFLTEIKGMKEVTLEELEHVKTMTIREALSKGYKLSDEINKLLDRKIEVNDKDLVF